MCQVLQRHDLSCFTYEATGRNVFLNIRSYSFGRGFMSTSGSTASAFDAAAPQGDTVTSDAKNARPPFPDGSKEKTLADGGYSDEWS